MKPQETIHPFRALRFEFFSWIFTVLFPRFLTLHIRWTVFPTRPVTFDETVVSKYGPVPGVGKSVRNSWRNFLVFPAKAPEKNNKEFFLSIYLNFTILFTVEFSSGNGWQNVGQCENKAKKPTLWISGLGEKAEKRRKIEIFEAF